MLMISCPWCGPREELEYRFGGESHVVRPGASDEVGDVEWGDYLHARSNPRDVHYERWVHLYGCRRWFNIARHTTTHRIEAVYRMNEAAPGHEPND